ncbi:MAG: SpoIIE family protein phosphatase [Prevotellaceae bacterium]|nr:SpoIIE family protein phosphatase [Prevotellaceae bacterium]MDO4931546.1 SpoIIE family protein phosphatase [Prevotellaceae bacterium]
MATKILSVDDEQDLELLLRQYFRRKIRNGEYIFLFAHNGIEALQVLEEHPDTDIVLSDINMPEMDGLTLLRELNSRHNPALKVIMVSAYGEMGNIRSAMNNGAFDFATKPIDLDDLQLTIEKAIQEIEFVKQTQKEHGQLRDIKGDLAMAADTQLAILPTTFPPFSDLTGQLDIFASMKPASDVGGDFYDFYRIDENHIGFTIADVSGKGVPAAIFMAVSHTLLRFAGRKTLDAVSVINESNDILACESFDSMFVTLFYGVYNVRTGVITYVNAGHNPPYILRADGSMETLPLSPNISLGVVERYSYKSATVQLNHGDSIVTFTDGVTEACNDSGELYGEQRLEALLASCRGMDAQRTVERIIDAVHEHTGNAEQSDDITILTLKRL